MERALIDDACDDMHAAWGEPVDARARALYASVLAGIDSAACRAALDAYLMEDRERRPSPGALRTRALAYASAQRATDRGHLTEREAMPSAVAKAATAPSAQAGAQSADRGASGRPASAAASPSQAPPSSLSPPWVQLPVGASSPSQAATPVGLAPHRETTAKSASRSGAMTALILAGGALAGSALIGGLLSFIWIRSSTDPELPENLAGITGGIGLVAGLGITWMFLVAWEVPVTQKVPSEEPIWDTATLMAGGGPSAPAAEPATYLTVGQVKGVVRDAMPGAWPDAGTDVDSRNRRAYTGASAAAGTFVGLALSAPDSPVRTPVAQLDRAVIAEVVARTRQAMLTHLCLTRPREYDQSVFDVAEPAGADRFGSTTTAEIPRRLLSWFTNKPSTPAHYVPPLVNWALSPLGAARSFDAALESAGVDSAFTTRIRELLDQTDREISDALGEGIVGEIRVTFGAVGDQWLAERFLETGRLMFGVIGGDE